MNLSLKFREQMLGDLWIVGEELDQLIAELNARLPVSGTTGAFGFGSGLAGDLTVSNITFQAGGKLTGDEVVTDAAIRWLRGPWFLDDARETDNIAIIKPPDPAAGTYNDYEPPGLNKAIGIDIEPTGAVTITGIKATHGRQKRFLFLRNRDSSNSITLSDASASSAVGNRFDLPTSSVVATASTETTLRVATVSLTEAQLEAMDGTNGTDVTVVSAPGAGKIAVLISCFTQINLTSVYTNNPAFTFQYAGGATVLWTNTSQTFSATTGKKLNKQSDSTTVAISPTFDPANAAINVNLSAALTGSGSATAIVSVVYTIVSQI